MTILEDPYLRVRAIALYVAVVATIAVWVWKRPGQRAVAGALLASIWNLPMLFALHLAAVTFGWWSMDATGGVLLGMPVDLYLIWAWLWGAVPALALQEAPVAVVVALALAIDLVAMPAASPVVRLGPMWLAGEAVGLVACLAPAQLLARWTAHDEHLPQRMILQMIAFSGLTLFLLPIVIIQASGSTWMNPFDRPAWQLSLMVQVLAVPAMIGLTAVQEFVERGKGTPVPFDPPRLLVSSGIYAYVRNPMQLSATLLLLVIGLFVWNVWIGAAGIMAHIYSAGLAGWDEDDDLVRRFGERWSQYKKGVRAWVPRWRPWYPEPVTARLYVSENCDMCSQVGRWFSARAARGLVIVPAESHPSLTLMRMTYEPVDDGRSASGIEAFARAIEHIHLGWAFLGFVLRVPLVRPLIQMLADASGAEPRPARVDLAVPRSTCK